MRLADLPTASVSGRGGDDRRDALILENRGLAAWAARRHRRGGPPAEDLVQAGLLGLVRAARDYAPRPGATFATYAASWARQEVRREVAATSRAVCLTRHEWDLAAKFRATRDALTRPGGDPPDDDAVLDAMGPMTPRRRGKILDVLRAERSRTFSISERDAVPDGDDGRRAAPEAERIRSWLMAALDRLDPRSRYVLVHRYGVSRGLAHPVTLPALACRLGVDVAEVERVEREALGRLRGDYLRTGGAA